MADSIHRIFAGETVAGHARFYYDSIMCSIMTECIAEIRRAIDDLAAEAQAAEAHPDRREAGQALVKLAHLWERLAELDPEVARRKHTYEA